MTLTRIRSQITTLISDILPFAVLKHALPRTFVIYGHLVSDHLHPVSEYYKYPSFADFDRLLQQFTSMSYKFVSLPEFLLKNNEKKILLTFDDGFKSIYEDLNPFLKSKNIPYAVFILTDSLEDPAFYIKTIKPSDRFSGQTAFLSEKEILELKEQGVHIGFHTHNHIKLEPEDLKKTEILKQLEIPEKYKKLFSYPLSFAYPYCAPANFSEFNDLMSIHFNYKFFFDTKGFIENQGNHIFRVSIDAQKGTKGKNWLIKNIKLQLLPRLKALTGLSTRKKIR